MKSHVDVYIYATIISDMFNINDNAVIATINESLNIRMTKTDLEMLRKGEAPKTAILVKALKTLGFQPLHISKLLDIHSGTVAYHSRNTNPGGYASIVLNRLISDEWERESNKRYRLHTE